MRLRERPAAEREHPRALDPALADERDVGRPAADVDEQRAGLADLLGAEDAGDGVRLGDDLEQLEVELADATLCSAPRWTSGANALKIPILTWRPWKPTGLVSA